MTPHKHLQAHRMKILDLQHWQEVKHESQAYETSISQEGRHLSSSGLLQVVYCIFQQKARQRLHGYQKAPESYEAPLQNRPIVVGSTSKTFRLEFYIKWSQHIPLYILNKITERSEIFICLFEVPISILSFIQQNSHLLCYLI